MNNVILGSLLIVGFVILYISALIYIERKIARKENNNLENNIDKLNDKA